MSEYIQLKVFVWLKICRLGSNLRKDSSFSHTLQIFQTLARFNPSPWFVNLFYIYPGSIFLLDSPILFQPSSESAFHQVQARLNFSPLYSLFRSCLESFHVPSVTGILRTFQKLARSIYPIILINSASTPFFSPFNL